MAIIKPNNNTISAITALPAAIGTGKIAQIVSTNKTDTWSESVASAGISGLVTGLTVDITPSATSSKILIIVNSSIGAPGEHGMGMALFRDSTQIDLGGSAGSRSQASKAMIQCSGGGSYFAPLDTHYLDSPSSTSELTYGIKIRHSSSSTQTIYCNISSDDTDNAKYSRPASTITAMEVLA